MTFEYFPGDHFTVGTPEYRNKGLYFIAGSIENGRVKTKRFLIELKETETSVSFFCL